MATSTATSAQPLSGARRGITTAVRLLLWVMAAGVVVQVFLAGMTIFGEDVLETHRNVGWAVHTLGLLVFILSIVGPRTREAMAGTFALVVLNTIQIMISQADSAAVAALHPTLALAVLGMSAGLALRLAPRPRA